MPKAGAGVRTLLMSREGPGVLFDALDPTIKRWYVPQELFAD